MPRIKTIEARLAVSDVARSAAFFEKVLGFNVTTLWPQALPEFAILVRDGLRVQVGKADVDSRPNAAAVLWLDVDDLLAFHAHVARATNIEWGPEVYSYGRREFGFKDPDGNWVIVSEVTSDPPTCVVD